MINTPCHNQLLQLIYSQKGKMDILYNDLSKKLSIALSQYKVKSASGVWVRNSEIEKKVDKILLGFNSELLKTISTQSKVGWTLSEDCSDKLVKEYIKGIELDAKKKESLLFRNEAALSSFLTRKHAGMELSDRVWNLTTNSKEQLEYLLQSGITEGRSATSMATDLKEYLKEPNRRYRRLRNKDGKLIYSEPAKNYHPGQGVYRSSYKNAMRLSRNETNMAYRTADYERRQNMKFARGVTVHASSSHDVADICDYMEGDYPKGFKFTGWHSRCICYATTKLLSKKEFIEHINGGKIRSNRYINKIPKRAEKHINSISQRINGWSNKPYFIEDNFKHTKKGYILKKSVLEIKK